MKKQPLPAETDCVLRDGGSIHLRPLRPADGPLLQDLLARVSPRSAYLRFLGTKRGLSAEEVRALTDLDFERNAALAAVLREGDREKIVGVGRYARLDDGGRGNGDRKGDGDRKGGTRAEVAFLVEDAHQGRGIGTLLMERLVPIARQAGITEFEAEVLGENNRMLEVFQKSGFVIRRAFQSGIFRVTFPTEETADHLSASHRRERQAAALSVRPILNPSSVALVGASRRPGSIGHAVLRNLVQAGFQGPLYPVNPQADTLEGLRAFPRVSAIGSPVDLAVIAVPAAAVEEVVADCARAGVRGLVVISAGFGEIGPEGREAQKRLVRLVRASGMRLVGPNCLGVLNTDPQVRLNATFASSAPPAGNIGMSSQSGALGIAILDYLRQLNLGVSTFVSVGNKADISGNDLLAYWAEDPRTEVIVLYLESFGNPRRFAQVAPEVARRKPIIAVKSGRSAAGTRAASSHSASLASLDVAVEALFEQAGVIRTDTLEELFDVAALLGTQPAPTGPRVGVVTNAGGPGILLADACEARGLKLPELGEETRRALREFLPGEAGLSNPVDLIASATPEAYRRAIGVVGRDPQVDSLVVIYIPVLQTAPEEIARAIQDGAAEVPPEKPVLSVFLGARGAPPLLTSPSRRRIPSYSFPENAALALACAERYGRWRARPRGDILRLDPFTRDAVRAVVDRVLERAEGPVWLEATDLALVLRALKIDFAAGEQVAPGAAVEAAARLGYPLVAKAVSPGLLHKSDVGGVVLGLTSPAEVTRAVEELRGRLERIGKPLEAVFLQRQVSGGIEALVGVTTDRTFGPLLVCGLGGVLVELLKDVSFRLPPVSDLDAEEMLDRLRSRRLLEGYRGAPAGDRRALREVIRRISALVEAVPEVLELDLNPVKVLPPGQGATVVDGRMRIARQG